ncbi:MAG: hypothetical protein ACI4O9_06825 [Akkermansia sp.]
MNALLAKTLCTLMGLYAVPCLLSSCATAPSPAWADTPAISEKREALADKLLQLTKEPLRARKDVQEEAHWLADTAYKGGAAIARVNRPLLLGWFNNFLVNSRYSVRERGLCWHYQHDLFRELRRRPLHYFRLGCCVMDYREGSEHHCVYISPQGKGLEQSVVIDAWWFSGKLKVWNRSALEQRTVTDEPNTTAFLAKTYPEGHHQPVEHWAKVRRSTDMCDYTYSDSPEGRACRQGQLMQQSMEEGLRRRNGQATDY